MSGVVEAVTAVEVATAVGRVEVVELAIAGGGALTTRMNGFGRPTSFALRSKSLTIALSCPKTLFCRMSACGSKRKALREGGGGGTSTGPRLL